MNRYSLVSRRVVLAVCVAAAWSLIAPNGTYADEPATNSCANLCGCWDCGYWKSFCNTHHGKLRAKVECNCGQYSVTFSGTFFGVIPFRYTQKLTVTSCKDGVTYFRASRNLPMFGGTFCMTGSATSCKFTAHYTSPKDRGVFVMSR